jgi:hypothetical protein
MWNAQSVSLHQTSAWSAIKVTTCILTSAYTRVLKEPMPSRSSGYASRAYRHVRLALTPTLVELAYTGTCCTGRPLAINAYKVRHALTTII